MSFAIKGNNGRSLESIYHCFNHSNVLIMKKIILMAVVIMAAMCSTAQEVQFGVKGGLNLSTESKYKNINGYSGESPAFKVGFHIGGIVNWAINERFEMETDLLYSMQGFKDRMIGMTEQRMHNKNYTVTSHYLTLPIAAKVNVINGLYLECGPQFGFLLSKKDRLEGVEIDNSFNSNNTKKFDFGILGGLGYKFENGLFLDARYIRGFTGTSKVFDGGKNRVIQLSLGYLF